MNFSLVRSDNRIGTPWISAESRMTASCNRSAPPTVAIGLQTAAYFAELCRAGINAVDRGQWEAARAIGMRTTTMLRLIIFPQALRRIVPILFSLVAEVIKGSSLAAVITFGELTYAASQVSADTYRPIETYTVVALIYFVIIFTASRLASHFERRLGFQR